MYVPPPHNPQSIFEQELSSLVGIDCQWRCMAFDLEAHGLRYDSWCINTSYQPTQQRLGDANVFLITLNVSDSRWWHQQETIFFFCLLLLNHKVRHCYGNSWVRYHTIRQAPSMIYLQCLVSSLNGNNNKKKRRRRGGGGRRNLLLFLLSIFEWEEWSWTVNIEQHWCELVVSSFYRRCCCCAAAGDACVLLFVLCAWR